MAMATGNGLVVVDACTSYDRMEVFLKKVDRYIINANPLIGVLVVEGLRAIDTRPSGKISRVDKNAKYFFDKYVIKWYFDSHPPAVVLKSFGCFNKRELTHWRKNLGKRIDEKRDITEHEIKDLFGNLADDLEKIVVGKNERAIITMLALQGLNSLTPIEKDLDLAQKIFDIFDEQGAIENFKRYLIKWRNETPLDLQINSFGCCLAENILENMTIYSRLGVPLFIDNYGERLPVSSKCFPLVAIENIDGDTSIGHVTHSGPKDSIIDSRCFRASLKNHVEGCWFGVDDPESRYGCWSFKTTLTRLGVKGLQQGEIIQYKNEINVILYASDDAEASFQGLQKPNQETLEKEKPDVFVHLTFFIPKRFFPEGDTFWDVIDRPVEVVHGPICVPNSRAEKTKGAGRRCPELFCWLNPPMKKHLTELDESGGLSPHLETMMRKERDNEGGINEKRTRKGEESDDMEDRIKKIKR